MLLYEIVLVSNSFFNFIWQYISYMEMQYICTYICTCVIIIFKNVSIYMCVYVCAKKMCTFINSNIWMYILKLWHTLWVLETLLVSLDTAAATKYPTGCGQKRIRSPVHKTQQLYLKPMNRWNDDFINKLWPLDWTSSKNKLSALTGNNASQSQN